MDNKYDCLIFDLGNVVLDFDYNKSVKRLTRESDISKSAIYDLFFDSKITELHDTGKISSFEFFRIVKKELGIKIDFKAFQKIWNEIFFENKAVSSLIRRLKKDYKVILLSNTNRLHFEYIKDKFDVIHEFDELIVSYEVKALKPDPRIFRYAIKKAGTAPERIFYTDDRRDLIDRAKLHGIDANLFKSAKDLKNILSKKGILKKNKKN